MNNGVSFRKINIPGESQNGQQEVRHVSVSRGIRGRIDTPGALHHIIVRGIERRQIFYDDSDRENFLKRFGAVLLETGTPCFAWAMIARNQQSGGVIANINVKSKVITFIKVI